MGTAKILSGAAQRGLAYHIFAEALDRQEKSREQFLLQRCNGDALLRAQVGELLEVAAGDGLDTDSLRGTPRPPEETLTGKIFGRFRLVERIGDGGMGVVYRAERTDGVQQSVAIKLVASTLAAAEQLRFKREAQLLARLEHPSIARLIDAGIEDARPWIAIEFVRGERVDEYCKARALTSRDIVRLLVLLADAVGSAHGMLVVHSDIKPANVLVTADGLPKLVDFGISTALRDAGAADSPTLNLGRLFSPHYAAPEQINGGPLTVATDVFGLGALAYRLLTGSAPHAAAGSPVAYLIAVTQRDVEMPSRAAAVRNPDAAHALRGDLDAILCKALDRDPSRRYATAIEMQADLKRYLEERPVAARTPSILYRAGKFVRRNALVTGLSGLLMLSLVTGATYAAISSQRTALARDIAARRGEFLESLLKSADPRSGRRDMSVTELLDSATASLDSRLAGEPLAEASLLGLIADTYDGLGRYPEALIASDRQIALLKANGGTPIDFGRAFNSRGEILREQGKWAEAEPVMRSTVALLRPLHAPMELARALDLLGIVLGHMYQEKGAEAAFLEEIAIESAGDEQLKNRRVYPYYALDWLYVQLGHYDRALEYGRKCLELAKRTMPPDHQDLLAFEGVYASTLERNHQSAAAEELLRDVVAREIRVSGPAHKDTLLTQGTLAGVLLELHRDADAATLAQQTAIGLEGLLGSDNAYTLAAWETFGSASCNAGHEETGLAVLRQVEARRRKLLPAGDRFIYTASSAVGTCLSRLHRFSEAEPILLAAAAGLEAARGSKFQGTQQTYGALRDLYLATSRGQDAALFAAKLQN